MNVLIPPRIALVDPGHDIDVYKRQALDATLLRSRAYVAEGGQRWFAAVAERSNVGKRAWWYSDIDGDTVAKQLDRNNACL